MTTNSLAQRAGSEVYLRDLALALMQRGRFPVIYSPVLGEVAEELRTSTIPVIDDLDQMRIAPDMIHGQHHHETMTAVLRYPDVPAVFVCHGWAPWEEMPPVYPTIMRYVAVDDLCRERLLTTEHVSPEKISTIYNFADLDRFARVRSLPAVPRKALIYSNRADASAAAIREACSRRGIGRVDVIGEAAGTAVARPEDLLAGYDIVFAKARAAIEAMASGSAVVVTDFAGLAGMVTLANVEAWRGLNFGVRTMQARERSVEAIERELMRYDAEDASAVTGFIRTHAGLDAAVDRWVEVYRLAGDDWARRTTSHDSEDRLLAASRYLRLLSPRVKSLYLAEQQLIELQRDYAALDARTSDLEKTLSSPTLRFALLCRGALRFVRRRLRALRRGFSGG